MSCFLRHLDAFLKLNNPLPNTLERVLKEAEPRTARRSRIRDQHQLAVSGAGKESAVSRCFRQ